MLSSTAQRAALSAVIVLLLSTINVITSQAAPVWAAKLDAEVRFYQATELGVIVVGTEKSLYTVDAETGELLWRRKDTRLDETDVATVPGTEVLLLSLERGDKPRMEAVDFMEVGRNHSRHWRRRSRRVSRTIGRRLRRSSDSRQTASRRTRTKRRCL